MSRKKTVWIPALIAILAAVLIAAYHFCRLPVHAHVGRNPRLESGMQSGALHRPPRKENDAFGGLATTLGTIAVFLGAGSFCWLWFKKKRRSASYPVRQAALWLNRFHAWAGWASLALIAVHGAYFLILDSRNDKLDTGIAAFVLLLAVAGYGAFIKKIRNKWMRTVHRTLGLLWLPAVVLHAGGSAVLAIALILAVGALAEALDRWAKQSRAAENP